MQRNRRRIWIWIVSLLAGAAVLAAAVSALFQLAVNAVPGYRRELEQRVAKAAGHPVTIVSMALTWREAQPGLELHELTLFDGATRAGGAPADGSAPLVKVRELRLGFDLWRLLRADFSPSRVEVHGLELHADVDDVGHWTLRGIDGGGSGGSGPALLQSLRRLRLFDCRLEVRDALLGGASLSLAVRSAEVGHLGGRYTGVAELEPPATIAGPAHLSAEIDGDPARPQELRGNWRLTVDEVRGWPWATQALVPGTSLRLEGAHLRLDGRLEAGRVAAIDIDAAAARVVALRDAAEVAQLAQLRLEAQAQPTVQCWQATLRRLDFGGVRGAWSAGGGHYTCSHDADGFGVSAELASLRLDDVAPWLALLRELPETAQRIADLRGDLREVRLETLPPDSADRGEPRTYVRVAAQLDGVGLASSGGDSAQAIGFSGLSGQLLADNDSGVVQVARTPIRLSLPEVFAQALPVDALSTELRWRHEGRDWHVWTPAFEWQALGTRGGGHFDLRLADAAPLAPRLRVAAQFSADGVAPLRPFIPVNLSPATRDWLDQALVAARVPEGTLVLDGPLADYPFVETRNGRWGMEMALADVTLRFSPEWPPVEQLQGRLFLRGHGIAAQTRSAQLGGAAIDSLSAAIEDFRDSKLAIDGTAHGDAAKFYEVLRASPLHQKLSGLLDQTEASGTAALELHLDLALAESPLQTRARGRVTLDGAKLTVEGVEAPITAVGGVVEFGGFGVAAEALDGMFYGRPLHALIHSEAAHGGREVDVLEAQTEVPMAAAEGLAAAYLPPWLRRQMSGTGTLRARLPLGGPEEGKLSLVSDLVGVASRLPPPLAKSAPESLEVRTRIGSDAAALRIGIEVADALRLGLRFADKRQGQALRGVEARLDNGAVPRADADGIVVRGSPPEFNLAPWIAFASAIGAAGDPDADAASARTGAAPLAFVSVDLQPQRLFYRSAVLRDPHLHAVPVEGGVRIELEGESAQGRIDWNHGDGEGGGRIAARLQRLHFEPVAAGAVSATAPAAAPPSGEDAEPFVPADAPTLDLDIAALAVGESELGHFTLATARVAGGQSLQSLKMQGGDLQLDANGVWRRSADRSSAELSFSIDATQIDRALGALGYAKTLAAKQARFKGALAWPPDAAGIAPAQAAGTLELDLREGNLKAVEPGAGRVLGLLNLYALPRRLLFDFRDVVGSGLGFDTLSGRFTLGEGQARTEDVLIKSPSVKIAMRGRVGLAAQDYDEHVTVQPDVTTGVTVGAALAGGPVGALIALVAQEVFGKPFNKLSEFSYHVTGSWDDPQIERGGGKSDKMKCLIEGDHGGTCAAPPVPAENGAAAAPPAKEKRQ